MDDLVVGLEHVEAMGEACLGGLKHREIVQILDLVMRVELLQEELQPRRKPGAEVLRRSQSRRETPRWPSRARRRSRGTCRGAAARTAPWRRDWRGCPRPRAGSGRSAGAGRPASRRGCRGRGPGAGLLVQSSGVDSGCAAARQGSVPDRRPSRPAGRATPIPRPPPGSAPRSRRRRARAAAGTAPRGSGARAGRARQCGRAAPMAR